MIQRRSFLMGLGALFAAPAVCHASVLMPLRGEVMLPFMDIPAWCPPGWVPAVGGVVDRFQFPELHAWFKKTRTNGAHLSGQFRLPDSNFGLEIKETTELYDGHRIEFLTRLGNPCAETVEVPLVAAKPMVRPNGKVAQPGMLANCVVDVEAVRAWYPDANRIHEEAKNTLTGCITKERSYA